MLMLGRIFTLALALLGGVSFSQAPEFTQQYRQRIGGALDELRILITDFDTQAQRNGLDREQALDIYAASPERFLRNQGETMRRTFQRYERLSGQQHDLAAAYPLTRPFIILGDPDQTIVANAWREYVPAVPVDVPGLVWAAGGLFCGWLAALLFGATSRGVVRAVKRPKKVPTGAWQGPR